MKNIQEIIFRNQIIFMGLLAFISFKAQAALPLAPTGGAGEGGSDFMEVIKGYAGTGIETAGLIVAGVSFLWIAWVTIAKFNDARKDRAEWAEVGLAAVAGAAVLVFMAFLLNQSADVIGVA